MSKIPHEIKAKIAELYVPVKSSDYKTVADFEIAVSARNELCFAASFGYQLAKEEVEKVRGDADENYKLFKATQEVLANRDKEVAELMGLLKEVHESYVTSKYQVIDIHLTHDQIVEAWKQFKTENNL